MPKWEYKVVDLIADAEVLLNTFGEDGWELISVCERIEEYNTPSRTVEVGRSTHTIPAQSGINTKQRAYLKRPKQ